MSERSAELLLLDIQTAVRKILAYTQGMTQDDYIADTKTKEAVERNFQIIGEASARLPEAFKQQHDVVPWRLAKDFRNLVIHRYFGIDDQVVWDTVQLDLQPFLAKIDLLIADIQANPPKAPRQ